MRMRLRRPLPGRDAPRGAAARRRGLRPQATRVTQKTARKPASRAVAHAALHVARGAVGRLRHERTDAMSEDIREQVRSRYAAAAEAARSGSASCCDPGGCGEGSFGAGLYGATERESLPEGAVRASLGCGNPT